MAALRWDRWNRRLDGTQIGAPRGVLWGVAWVPLRLLGTQLNMDSSLNRAAVRPLGSSCEACVFVLGRESFAHIGLYTAKPLPQRIESHQGHSRDNASAMRINSQRLTWVGDKLVYGRRTLVRIERDGVYPEMWRVRLPDGGLTDMVNRTRAKDAALSITHRLLNMSETLSEAPPTAPNEFQVLSDLEAVLTSPGARQGTGRKR
jgi:hypothetical protein